MSFSRFNSFFLQSHDGDAKLDAQLLNHNAGRDGTGSYHTRLYRYILRYGQHCSFRYGLK